VLKEYVHGEKCVLARNPHYWEVDKEAAPALSRRVCVPDRRDLNTMVLKFSSGETDIIDPDPGRSGPRCSRTRPKRAAKVYDGPGRGDRLPWFNLNPRIPRVGRSSSSGNWRLHDVVSPRDSHAIDREGIVKSVLWPRRAALRADHAGEQELVRPERAEVPV
jgi:ABC-type transport system substrate-binding protein